MKKATLSLSAAGAGIIGRRADRNTEDSLGRAKFRLIEKSPRYGRSSWTLDRASYAAGRTSKGSARSSM